jgi:hypothetical protein
MARASSALRLALASGFFAVFLAPQASAETYCRGDQMTIYDGGDFQSSWTVTVATVRKPSLPWQKKAFPGCTFNGRFVGGMHRPPEIIEKPTLGRAYIGHPYQLIYEASRTGQDRVGVRIHWLSFNSGKPESAVIHLNVNVIDHAL